MRTAQVNPHTSSEDQEVWRWSRKSATGTRSHGGRTEERAVRRWSDRASRAGLQSGGRPPFQRDSDNRTRTLTTETAPDAIRTSPCRLRGPVSSMKRPSTVNKNLISRRGNVEIRSLDFHISTRAVSDNHIMMRAAGGGVSQSSMRVCVSAGSAAAQYVMRTEGVAPSL
jgi:hypothetical protein